MSTIRLVKIRHMIKLAVAGLLSVALAMLLNLEPLASLLLVFYTMLMVQSTLGETLSVIKPLILWCIAGLVLGVVLSLAFGELVETHRDFIWIPLAILVFYGAVIFPISLFAKISLITALLIVALGGQEGEPPVVIALWRALYLAIAACLSLLVSVIVFPMRATTMMRQGIGEIVTESRRLFGEIVEGGGESIKSCHSLRKRIEAFSRSIDLARQEGFRFDREHANWGGAGLFRINGYLFYLARKMSMFGGNPLVEETRGEIQEVIDLIDRLMERLGRVLMRETVELEDVHLITNHLRDVIQERKAVVRDQSVEVLADYFAYIHSLKSFAHDLDELIRRVSEPR